MGSLFEVNYSSIFIPPLVLVEKPTSGVLWEESGTRKDKAPPPPVEEFPRCLTIDRVTSLEEKEASIATVVE